MPMSTSPPKGTFDVTPNNAEAWKDSDVWQYVESKMRETCHLFGLREIKTPLFEKIELFKRSVGDVSDIVTKEMYEFEDKGGRQIALRPEGTASSVRAMINDRVYDKLPLPRAFYFGPMFRYERGQKGRYRQHYQLGVSLLAATILFLTLKELKFYGAFIRAFN